MGRSPLDFGERIAAILENVEEQPPEAVCPIRHFQRTVGDLWNFRGYVERKIRGSDHYPKKMADHMAALDRMLIVSVIETFERFLKEIAAACVDHLASYALDDRFDFVSIRGGELAAHFGEQTLGKALCESGTWLDCDDVNKRFRRLLALPLKPKDGFQVFEKQGNFSDSERTPFEIMSIVWQLRHSIVHNVGVLTQSDGVRLRLLTRRAVKTPSLLRPTRDNVRHIKEFLTQMAEDVNQRCGVRLAEVLTELHAGNPGLFQPREEAESVAVDFQMTASIAGVSAIP